MPNNSQINIGVKYNVDQASVNAVKKSLQDLQNIKLSDFHGSSQELEKVKTLAGEVQSALNKAFNVNLNSLNVQKFSQELGLSSQKVNQIYTTFSKVGAQGQVAFSKMTSSILTTNLQLKQTSGLISRMGETMANTVKWGIASSIMNTFTNSVRSAFDYVKALDSSLNDIRIVTKQSSDQMANFATQANSAAQSLGRSTMDYTKAALTFYQQGLGQEDVQARTEATLKAQNITGAGDQMADYLTAVWNGYKVANEEAELYVDKLAAVADSSASNMSQLAVAMSKVASSANLLGVPVDKLNAQIATITATTRQAPESVGNALKTIYSRINDIATGADDAQISLGNYSSKMAQVGISVLDANGRLRDTGDVIDEIGGKWQTLSHEQQIYLARTMAGQRQYNNLLALFENWGKYSDLVNVSMEAQGATAQKNSIYMESLAAKMEQLGAAGERLKSAFIDEEDLKGLVQFGTGAVNVFSTLIESIGGGRNAILMLGSIFTQVFSGTIATELNNIVVHFQNVKHNNQLVAQDIEKVRILLNSKGYESGLIKQIVDMKSAATDYYKYMSQAQKNQHNELLLNVAETKEAKIQLEERAAAAQKFAKSYEKSLNARGVSTSEGRIQDIAKDTVQHIQELQQQIGQIKIPIKPDKQQTKASFTELKGIFESTIADIGKATANDLPGFDNIRNKIKQLKHQSEPAAGEVRKLKMMLQEFLAAAHTNSAEVANDNVKRLGQQAKDAAESFNHAKAAAEGYLNAIKQRVDIQNVVKMVAGFGQLTSVLMSSINLVKTWKDQNVSAGQKIVQTISTISMTVPMAINGIKQVGEGFKTIQSAVEGYATARKIAGLTGTLADEAQMMSQAELQAVYGVTGIKAWESLGPYAIIAGIIAAAVAAIYGLYKAWNSAAEAAKKAAETAKQAQEVYNDLKQSYNNLKTSLDDLSQAENKLKDLTAGTQEWRDALQEVNQKVLEIIKEFPQLKGQITTTQEGLLGLSEEGQQRVKELYQQRTFFSGLSYAYLDQQSTQASNFSKITNVSRDLDGALGLTPQDLQRVVNAVNQYGTGILQNSQKLESLANVHGKGIDVVQQNSSQVAALAAQVKANTQASQSLTSSIIQTDLAENELYQSSNNQQAFARLVQNAFDNVQLNDDYYAIKTNQFNRDQWVVDTQKVSEAYKEMTGFAGVKGTIDNNYKIQKQIGGQWQKVNASVVENAVAYQQAVENAESIYEQVNQTLKGMSDKEGQLYSLFVGGLDKVDWSKLSLNDIQDLIGNDQLIEKLSELLQVDPDVIYKSLGSAATSIKDNMVSYLSNQVPRTVADGIRKINQGHRGQYSQQIEESLGRMLTKSFSKGIDQFEATKDILDGLDFQDILPFEQVLNSLDFSSLDVDTFREEMSKAGVELRATNPELEVFIEKLKDTQAAINPEEVYKTIHDIIDDLEQGGTITADEANALEKAGISLDGYFEHLANGSLKLKGDAKEFYDYANNQSLEGFKQQIKSLTQENQGLRGFNQSYFAYDQNATDEDNNRTFQQFSSTAQKINARGNIIGDYDQNLLQQQLKFLQAIGEQAPAITQAQQDIDDKLIPEEATLKSISDLVIKHRGDWQNIQNKIGENSEQMRIYREQLRNAQEQAQKVEKVLDPDVDEDKWRSLTGYIQKYQDQINQGVEDNDLRIDDQLETNQIAASDLAQAMLRYNSALEQVSKNYEDWQEALNSDSLSQQVIAGQELQNVYADLLDLPFGDQLSAQFTQSTSNLELLKQAVYGTGEQAQTAYNQLQKLAIEDISAQVGLDTSQFYSEQGALYNQFNTIQNELDDIEVGAFIDDTQALQAMNEIINAADMTQEQATDLLASMGVDAQVEEKQVPKKQRDEFIDAVPHVTYQQVDVPELINGPYPTQGTINVPTIHYSGEVSSKDAESTQTVTALRVKSARKASGGGFKMKHSTAPSTGKSGGGGKGGGGGKKPQNVKAPKASKPKQNVKDRSDPYHDVNLELKKQEKILDDLEKQEKKLTGQKRLENLKSQNDQLLKQQSILNKKSGIADTELATLRTELEGSGIDIKFNVDGSIANYNDALDNATKNYNNAINNYNNTISGLQKEYADYLAVYNAMSAEDQQANKTRLDALKDQVDASKQAAQAQLEAEQKKYEAIKNNVKQYESTLELQKDIAEQIDKIKQQIIENNIAVSKIRVDLTLDAGELERNWLDFEKKFIKKIKDDDLLGQALYDVKNLQSYVDTNQINQVNSQIARVQKAIDTISKGGKDDIYGDHLTDAQERLEELLKQQQDQLVDMQELVDNIHDTWLDAMDKVKDDMDNVINQHERVNSIIQHNVKLTEMLYGDKAYGTMQKYYELQKANDQQTLDTLRAQQSYWQNQMNSFIGENGQIIDQQAFDKAKENFDDLTNKVQSQLEKMIETLSKQWQNRVDGIIEKMNNALIGGRGLDYVNQEWDYVNQWDDTFLDPVESRMGINQIQGLYQEAIDGLTGSPAQQQKMNKLMSDQLKLLREKDNLTQYDLDRAKAALEVEKARLALEEARDSKTKMRLRRDSQGNYTYQYVADEQKLSDLQKSLADAEANLYNMDKEHYKETLDDLYNTYKDYIEKRKALEAEYAKTQDEEERKRIQARIELLQKSYGEYFDAVNKDSKFNKDVYLAYSTALGAGLDPGKYTSEELNELVDKIVPQAGTTIEEFVKTISGKDGLLAATKDGIGDVMKATAAYDADVIAALETAGTSLTTIQQVVSKTGQALNNNLNAASQFVGYYDQVVNKSKEAFEGIEGYYNAAEQLLKTAGSPEILTNLEKAYNILQTTKNSVGQKVDGSIIGNSKDGLYKNTLIDTERVGVDSNGEPITGQIQTRTADSKKEITDYDTYQASLAEVSLDRQSTLSIEIRELKDQIKRRNDLIESGNTGFDFETVSDLATRQVELQNEDYKNQIAQMVRQVATYIGHVDTIEELNQNVNITASFPNVIDHIEIERAFNELVNIAAQQAARNG